MDNSSRNDSGLVSIIIPVRDGGTTLEACLRALRRSHLDRVEIIVVDDHSEDESAAIAKKYADIVLNATDRHGANAARNHGAEVARGDILVFLDADVIVGRDTIGRLTEIVQDENADAVVGVYTTKHRHESFVSQYKNLWVRYSYLKSPPAIDWLFGAISGIKKGAFVALGGFDGRLLSQQGNDDIELGKRMSFQRLRIVLSLDVEVEHIKQYTLQSFVLNEFHRSAGFTELAVKLGEAIRSFRRGFANVYPSFVLSTVLAPLILLTAGSVFVGILEKGLLIWMLVIYFVLNVRFLNYLEQVRGLFAMVAMIPLLFLDHLICFLGSFRGIVRSIIKI